MEEIHTAIRSEKKHRYIADLASLLGVESILYLHENSDRGSKKERNQIKFIATYPRDTPWVDTGVGLPPSQKLSLNENEIAIKLKASFNTLMQRDRYQMVIFDTSIMHNDPTGYLKMLSSLHQLPKAIIFLNIHHDQKNHELWGKISSDTNILLTIDLFHIGLAFLDLKMEKQHFILKS
tara:strand:+ start:3719 stop:4255 length:537 start_codon:yes stop_codon:yes gene_type:complete